MEYQWIYFGIKKITVKANLTKVLNKNSYPKEI